MMLHLIIFDFSYVTITKWRSSVACSAEPSFGGCKHIYSSSKNGFSDDGKPKLNKS